MSSFRFYDKYAEARSSILIPMVQLCHWYEARVLNSD